MSMVRSDPFTEAMTEMLPLDLTVQQHEDSHAYFALNYAAFAWNSVALIDHKCLCPDCYDAWSRWQTAAVSLAYDWWRWDTLELDIVSYGGKPWERAEITRIRPQLVYLIPKVPVLAAEVKQKCGIDCPDFNKPSVPITITRPPFIPVLPLP